MAAGTVPTRRKGGEMTDKPEDRPEDRRRTGPLGDDAETEAATRQDRSDASGSEPTRPIPAEQQGTTPETEVASQPPSGETDEKETRVIRTPPYGSQGDTGGTYPRGYFEAAEEREDRLRDMYGGVDWLASFLGFVFVVVAGGLFSLVAGLVLVPLPPGPQHRCPGRPRALQQRRRPLSRPIWLPLDDWSGLTSRFSLFLTCRMERNSPAAGLSRASWP